MVTQVPYKDRERHRAWQRVSSHNRQKIKRIIVIEFLGGKCCRCGFEDFRCLQIDHIVPILREKLALRTSSTIVGDIYADREDLDNIQILCANCHAIKSCYEDVHLYGAG